MPRERQRENRTGERTDHDVGSRRGINSIGLRLDIVGVILLFFFGLPNYVNPGGLEPVDVKTEDRIE